MLIVTETIDLEGFVTRRRARRTHRVPRQHGKVRRTFKRWARAALGGKLPAELSPKLALLIHGVGR